MALLGEKSIFYPGKTLFLLKIIKDQCETNQEIQALIQREERLFAPTLSGG